MNTETRTLSEFPQYTFAEHIRQSSAVTALSSDTCCGCGGLFDSRDLQFVVGRTDRRCRFCREGLLADVPEHERREAAEGGFGVPTYSTEELLDIRHLCIELWDLIKALPDPQPHVLYYRFWEDRSQGETGDIIGRSRARVWQLESRAIRQLRNVMHALPDFKAAAAEAADRTVQLIAANPALWARKWLAVFPGLSRYLLDRLAVDPDADVRWLVATRKDLPAEVEERLAKDPVWQVRQAVEPEVSRRKKRAAFEKTSHEDRLRRARDVDPRVRKEAATDPSMPADVVAELAADADSDVRYMVAVRPKLPRELLDRLAQDPVWQVREAAERALRRLQSASKGTSP